MTKNFVRRALYLKNNTLNTLHHMIFVYAAHMQKDNISSCFFHFFKILIFWVASGAKGQKWPKMTKNYVCRTPYLRKHIIVILIFGTHV